MSWCVPPWVYLALDFLCFLDLVDYFPMLGKFSAIISSNIFSSPFSLFWDSYNVNVGTYNVFPEFSEAVFIFFILLSIFCSMAVISAILSSRYISVLLHHLFCYWFFLVYSSSVFVCSLVLGLWQTFLVSSQSLPPLFFWDSGSSLLSFFWIIFLEGCLSPFHLFSGILSCPFIWDKTLYFFILVNFL